MRLLAPALLLFALPQAPQATGPNPVSSLQRFTLEVVHWEGSFGTYLAPRDGSPVEVDLARVGGDGLVRMNEVDAPSGTFQLDHLVRVRDRVQGSEADGWYRQVLLKGRVPGREEQTILELLVQYEIARWKETDGRRVKQSSNVTHATLRLCTLRDDDTIREYGLARSYHDRDAEVRVPAVGD